MQHDGHQKRHRAGTNTKQASEKRRLAKGWYLEQRDINRRPRRAAAMEISDNANQQAGRQRNPRPGFRHHMPPHGFKPEHAKRQGKPHQCQAKNIRLARIGWWNGRDFPRHQQEPDHPDRHIDPEYRAPAEKIGEDATKRRAADGTKQCGHRQPGHGRKQFFLAHAAQQQKSPDREHHGTTRTLQDAKGDQVFQAARLARKRRRCDEDNNRQHENTLGAEAIRDPA